MKNNKQMFKKTKPDRPPMNKDNKFKKGIFNRKKVSVIKDSKLVAPEGFSNKDSDKVFEFANQMVKKNKNKFKNKNLSPKKFKGDSDQKLQNLSDQKIQNAEAIDMIEQSVAGMKKQKLDGSGKRKKPWNFLDKKNSECKSDVELNGSDNVNLSGKKMRKIDDSAIPVVNEGESPKRKNKRKKKNKQNNSATSSPQNINGSNDDSTKNNDGQQDSQNLQVCQSVDKSGQGAIQKAKKLLNKEKQKANKDGDGQMSKTGPSSRKMKKRNKTLEVHDVEEDTIVQQTHEKKKNKKKTDIQTTKLMRKSMRERKQLPGLDSEPALTKFSTKSDDDPSSSEDDDDDYDYDGYVNFMENEGMEMDDLSTEPDDSESDDDITRQSPADSQEKLDRTVFVGNIPISMDMKAVKQIFKPFGKIQSARFRTAVPKKLSIPKRVANIKHEYNTNSTSLKGFVVFQETEDADKALSLNGTIVNGHHLRVDKAAGDNKSDDKATVFVGNLPFNVQDEELWTVFSECGTVKNVRVIRDGLSGVGKGFGFVMFEDESSVPVALALEGKEISGRQVRVKPIEKKGGPQNRSQRKGRVMKSNMTHPSKPTVDTPPKKKFGFKRFRLADRNDGGKRKTTKKLMVKRRIEQKKKKISSLFQTKK